jgi:hypothetical protein
MKFIFLLAALSLLLTSEAPTEKSASVAAIFISQSENPIPTLSNDMMKKQMIKCHPERVPDGVLEKGEHAIVTVSVDETGHVKNVQPNSRARWGLMVGSWESVNKCLFRPLIVDGKPVAFKGEVELPH